MHEENVGYKFMEGVLLSLVLKEVIERISTGTPDKTGVAIFFYCQKVQILLYYKTTLFRLSPFF